MSQAKILFVCTGNTCRSVMAEYVFKKMAQEGAFEAASAGISANPHFPIPSAVTKLLSLEGVKEFTHTPTRLDERLVEWADYLLVMEQAHKSYIDKTYPKAKEKTFLLKEFTGALRKGPGASWDIMDPIGSSDEVYKECLGEIKESLEKILEKLSKHN